MQDKNKFLSYSYEGHRVDKSAQLIQTYELLIKSQEKENSNKKVKQSIILDKFMPKRQGQPRRPLKDLQSI